MSRSARLMGGWGAIVCLQASLIGWSHAAGPAPAPPSRTAPATSETLEFSGSADRTALPPVNQGRGWNSLDSLSPGNSLGAVLSRSQGLSAPAVATPPSARQSPRISRHDANWSSLEPEQSDSSRAAEIAAGVRDPDASFRARGTDAPRRGSSRSSPAGSRSRGSLEVDASADTSLLTDAFPGRQTGSLDPILDRQAPRLGSPVASGQIPSFGAVLPGISQAPSAADTPSGISPGPQFRGAPGPRSFRELIGGQASSLDRTTGRSLFPIAGVRDFTREEINPVKPQGSSLDAVLPENRRRSTDPFASEFGIPPRSPYASSPSPLRELTSKLQGPSAPSAFQTPLPETRRQAPRSAPAEPPMRAF